jgi:cyclopropane-fatty-acyl-phospholipid synthase
VSKLTSLAERGWLPDWLIRRGIRRLLGQRLRNAGKRVCDQRDALQKFADELRYGPLVVEGDSTVRQPFEVPTAFFQAVLGKRLKYSCGYWPDGKTTLDDSEDLMLALTCERAQIADGMDILELGCGWGSLALRMAESYPNSQVTAISKSQSQGKFIERQASQRRLSNLKIITADIREFRIDKKFDRIVSIELFEHLRNYELLLGRIYEWLDPAGKLFVQLFCHRELAYFFDVAGDSNWTVRNFSIGGMMPADQLLPLFQRDLMLERHWHVDGTHYARTGEAWLRKFDANDELIRDLFENLVGKTDAGLQMQRWRMFFMALAEMFHYRRGQEWWVSQYRFMKR